MWIHLRPQHALLDTHFLFLQLPFFLYLAQSVAVKKQDNDQQNDKKDNDNQKFLISLQLDFQVFIFLFNL